MVQCKSKRRNWKSSHAPTSLICGNKMNRNEFVIGMYRLHKFTECKQKNIETKETNATEKHTVKRWTEFRLDILIFGRRNKLQSCCLYCRIRIFKRIYRMFDHKTAFFVLEKISRAWRKNNRIWERGKRKIFLHVNTINDVSIMRTKWHISKCDKLSLVLSFNFSLLPIQLGLNA